VRLLSKLLLAGLAALALLAVWVIWGLPSRSDVAELARRNPGPTALMRQREREAGERGRRGRRVQSWVPASRISRHLVHAVLSAEDQKFFGHEGVDWEAVKESVEANRRAGRFARGGSTITQQLAKNLYLGTAKTPARKLRELIVARWLEQELTKRRILEVYLNVIEWGDGIYGAEAAARTWLGKPAAALDASDAAALAAMIPNPRRINPRVNPRRHARAQRRVLWLMGQAGYLGRTGMGAEPPPEPADEGEDDDEAPAEAAGAEPAPVTPPPVPEPSPRPDATPEASPEPAPATPPAEPSPEPTSTPTPL
jgi:monofunctional biosynthetic peptidoglycan transglycosylase